MVPSHGWNSRFSWPSMSRAADWMARSVVSVTVETIPSAKSIDLWASSREQ
jgi:hypothetical protein